MPISQWQLERVVGKLSQSGVVAYPAEGVWGLGCLPESLPAVAKLLHMKRRPWQQGLILVAADIEQFAPYLEGLSEHAINELQRAWPGPVTYLVGDNGYCPFWIKGQHRTVAMRVSAHPVIRALCAKLGSPLVSTSANISGRPPARNSIQVRKNFANELSAVVPGQLCHQAGASEIRELATGKILRHGGNIGNQL